MVRGIVGSEKKAVASAPAPLWGRDGVGSCAALSD